MKIKPTEYIDDRKKISFFLFKHSPLHFGLHFAISYC